MRVTLVKKTDVKKWNDQLQEYTSELSDMRRFVDALNKGQLDMISSAGTENTQALWNDMALLQKRLKHVAEEEAQRAWATEGLTKFMEILQQGSRDVSALCEAIIRQVVNYMKANQGALYLLHEEKGDSFLRMEACFAYGRKKYIDQKIPLGHGLVGQVVLEKETIMLTDVPADYIKITSGLGEALPRVVLLVPLKSNDTVTGVLELASFEKIPQHQIAFLEKVSESIAATLVSIDNNQRMRLLLEETQHQAMQMREQEEELRQNLEELSATQEDMKRARHQTETLLTESQEQNQTLLAQEEELRQNMEELSAQRELIAEQMHNSERMRKELQVREEVFGHTTILSETDVYGTITHINSKFCEVTGYEPSELLGKPQNIVRHPDMPKEIFRLMWQTIKAGNVFKGIVKNRKKNGEHYWVDATIVPVKDTDGTIVKYIGVRYHIQQDALAELLYEQQLEKLGLLSAVSV